MENLKLRIGYNMCNVLLGTCIGDSLGMPFEKKLSNDPFLISWDGKSFLGSEHHKLKPGNYTDDGQFSIQVAESLIANNGFNPEDLANRYVELFASKTIRGYGRTTLMAVNNLIAGKSYKESGINGSFGNGTAMRAAPFGVYFRHDIKSLCQAVKIDSAITHASSEAEAGALAIALATALTINGETDILSKIWEYLPESQVKDSIYSLEVLINSLIRPQQALYVIGTKADVRQTTIASLYCFLKFSTYEEAIIAAIKAGGDTDTTAAITGALFGAKNGIKGIPFFWSSEIEDRDKLIILDSQLYNRENSSYIRSIL